jgi:hypothetical protein
MLSALIPPEGRIVREETRINIMILNGLVVETLPELKIGRERELHVEEDDASSYGDGGELFERRVSVSPSANEPGHAPRPSSRQGKRS